VLSLCERRHVKFLIGDNKMSIIVDALERVQSDRKESQEKYTTGAFAIDEGHEQTTDDEYHSKSYTKLFVAGLVIILCFNIYWIYEKSIQEQGPFSEEFDYSTSIPNVTTVNESKIKSTIGQITLEESEEIDEEFLSTFDNETENEIEKTIPINTTLSIIEEPVKTQNITPTPKHNPQWLDIGKQAFQDKGLEKAITHWKQGFIKQDSKMPIISIMINRVPEHASNTLKKLYENQIDAFSIQGLFKGKPAYFTLALYHENTSLNAMENIEQLLGTKPFKSTQQFIQEKINKLSNPPVIVEKSIDKKTPPTIPLKTKTVIKPKKISSKKRILLGQEAVISGDYRKAILTLRPVLFNNKANWEVLFWIGSAKLGLGLYNEADDYFKNALALNSEIPQLWTQRAIIAQEKNNHIAALKFLHKAQTLSPNAPEIILNIAYSNDALGDRNGAVYAYREFLSLTRNNTLFAQQRQAVNFRLEELGF